MEKPEKFAVRWSKIPETAQYWNYILDFFCPEERLGIELDGEVHNSDKAVIHDHKRKLFLADQGIRVLRFENRSVFEEYEYVLARIRSEFGWWQK